MFPLPILAGVGALALVGALFAGREESYGSGCAMKDAFGRLERGEVSGSSESFGGLIASAGALQNFLAGLPAKTAKQLYNESVSFITHYLGNFKALRNQGKFTAQYDRFKAAVLREGGLGPVAQREAANGVALIAQTSGKAVSSQDQQALGAIAQYQAAMILKGQG